jgi:hypothetical protein
MAKVVLGKHMAVFAARSERDRIRKFYCEVLGCEARITSDQVDRFQAGDTFFIFVWQDTALDDGSFLKATWLQLDTDKPDKLKQEILAFGAQQVEIPDPHFYFQAPGGQVFKIVGFNEDLSLYENSASSTPGASVSAA